jgi:hypothetical protein
MMELGRAALLGVFYALLVIAIVVLAHGAGSFVYQGF